MPKTQTFEEYFKNWKKKQPIKYRADGTPMDDSGATSVVIRGSAPHPLDLKGKKRERINTRIRRAGTPKKSGIKTIKGGYKYIRAVKRRKNETVEI